MVNNEMAMLIGAVFLGVFPAILAAWTVRFIFLAICKLIYAGGVRLASFVSAKIKEGRVNV